MFFFLFFVFFFRLFFFLLIPFHTDLAGRHGLVQRPTGHGATVSSKWPPIVRVVVGTRLIQGGHIAVAASAFAVGLGVMGIEVVTA